MVAPNWWICAVWRTIYGYLSPLALRYAFVLRLMARRAGSAVGVALVQLGFEQVHGLEERLPLGGGELI
jgi:hypothetical protein